MDKLPGLKKEYLSSENRVYETLAGEFSYQNFKAKVQQIVANNTLKYNLHSIRNA